MEKIKFFKFAAAAFCAVFAMSIASCSDDDDDNNASTLTCTPSNVTVTVGDTQKVIVKGGKEAYTAKSGNDSTATVAVKKDTIFVTGVKAGKVTVVVADSNKVSTSLPVTVSEKSNTKK